MNQRLASLDILRGLDMFLLLFLQPVAICILAHIDAPWAAAVARQLDHEVWEGFRFWDIIMPLFLFMSGASIPFAFAKYQESGQRPWRKIFRRVIILFLLGMLVQGNLLSLDPGRITIYVNTLQAIAIGYLIASIIYLYLPTRGQIPATLALLLAYSIPMSLWGDFSCEGNLANIIDAAILGSFRGDPSYTWIYTSLVFGVTVLLGLFAGEIMKRAKGAEERPRAALTLLIVGLVLVAVAYLWSFETPIIKRIWSGSMTLLSGGYCFILMAAFYWIVDCRGISRGLNWLKIYGMNAITAYCIGEIINFRSVVESVSFGLKPILGDFYRCWLTFGNFAILFLILLYMYRRRIFVKI